MAASCRLVESQGNVAKDPLIFWFNGGPGCSSIQGLLLAFGPFHVKNDGKTLVKNIYSWNKLASIVVIESLPGVGYSYEISEEEYPYSDDKQVFILWGIFLMLIEKNFHEGKV
ncbi:unnamed protein product [Gongylonema pulchrum]|uniref:Carboxypeptidase n=1 Tax=Gongylonema pulchrum TaxID=637853 RepID=A0A3P6U2H7_9BILA|nr:unnamed protein product [Gongylonema pulchrum]